MTATAAPRPRRSPVRAAARRNAATPILVRQVRNGIEESGYAKNWAQQVSGRRNEITLRALFAEELGALLQVPAAQRDAVFAVLREHGTMRDHLDLLLEFDEFNRIVELDEKYATERRYAT